MHELNTIVYKLASLPAESRDRVMNELTDLLTEEQLQALRNMVTIMSWWMDPKKDKAIRAAMAEVLYKEFNS